MAMIPKPTAPIAGALLVAPEWWNYLRQLSQGGDTTALAEAIQRIQQELAELQGSGGRGDIRTVKPILSSGTLAAGMVQLSLEALPNAGGGTLQYFSRDEFGRVAGTSSAEAPIDGKGYFRKDGAWVEVSGAGSKWLNGAAVPANSLGADGDYYLRTTALPSPAGNGDVYLKDAGAWTVVGNIQGSAGVKGDTGAPGPSSSCFPTANFDGGSGAISVGAWCEVFVPFGFTVSNWTLGADALGTLSVDIRVATFADYPPSGADSICGSSPPSLAGDNKARSSNLAGWSVDVPSGSFLRFFVTACAGITKATLTLEGERT